ncbi:hypothetical protein [Methylorubrum aminovorans]
MILRVLLVATGLLSGAVAIAEGEDALRTLQSHDWRVSAMHCAGRCSEDASAFARRMIGTDILARTRSFSSSFTDACPEEVGYAIRTRLSSDAIKDIRTALPSAASAELDSLDLPKGRVTGALVSCGEGRERTTIANIVAIDAGRLVIMIEGGMFLVASPRP